MKMLIVLLVQLIVCNTAKTQVGNKNLEINIVASSAFKGHYIDIKIVKKGDSVKIDYKIKDSIDFTAVRKDSRLVYLSGYFLQHRKDTNNDSLLMLKKEKYGLLEKYTRYTTGNLTIISQANKKYTALLNNIATINTDSLEIAENKKNDSVMDGSHFSFYIKSADHESCVCVHEPRSNFYSIFANLVYQTKTVCKLK